MDSKLKSGSELKRATKKNLSVIGDKIKDKGILGGLLFISLLYSMALISFVADLIIYFMAYSFYIITEYAVKNIIKDSMEDYRLEEDLEDFEKGDQS